MNKFKLKNIIEFEGKKSFSDYLSLSKKIDLHIIKNNIKHNIKIAILSNFTSKGLKDVFKVEAFKANILIEIFESDYNQYAQEILNPNSNYYKFNPDFTILFLDLHSLLGDYYYLPYEKPESERVKFFDNELKNIFNLVDVIKENSSTKILLHNFQKPTFSPLGIAENKERNGFFEIVEKINIELRDSYKTDNQVCVFDFDSFCSYEGKKSIVNNKLYYLADIRISNEILPNLCKSYISYLFSTMGYVKKCIVVDLDNTLWGGVVGEDGIDGIKLGPTPEGRPFLEFQQILLSYYKRGIILAVNSKNNYEDAINAINNHHNMILREKYFAALRINWDDKASNIIQLAKELNIGTDSMVFIDDDPANRALVSNALPEVFVLDLPRDPSKYVDSLKNLNVFNNLFLTKEDKAKGKLYADEKNRRILKNKSIKIDDYLNELNIKVKLHKNLDSTIQRISQLTQKTNQFNFTTKRYSEEQINEFIKDSFYNVYSLDVSDKFGNSGITALAIVYNENEKLWKIDTFLLSCRVMGRGIENALMFFIVEDAKKNNVEHLLGEYISTKKNIPAKDSLSVMGFSKIINKNNLYELNLSKDFLFPTYITIDN